MTRHTLRDIADQFQRWVAERAEKRNIPIVEAPKGRRDDFVDPYFERAKPDAIVVILKAREKSRLKEPAFVIRTTMIALNMPTD